MKKILHLVSTDIFSGAENVACQIIKVFSDEKMYEMYYVSKLGSNKKNLEEMKINYITLDEFNYKSIKKIIEKEKPNIIHAHDAKACVIASMFYKKCKIIGQIHGNHENMRKTTLKSILFNIACKRISKIIWVTKSALDNYKFKSNIIDKSNIIENIIDIKYIYMQADKDINKYEDYDLIFLGRMSYPKNPLRLIKIIKLIQKTKPNINVAIVGSGELDPVVKEQVKKEKLENNITFFGFVSNPYKILRSSKIMIMTSRYEGVPMCALEAMSFGLPIVSTPTDGLKDLIENGKEGYLSSDDNCISEKIIELLENKKEYEKMSKNAMIKSTQINDTILYKNKIENIYK